MRVVVHAIVSAALWALPVAAWAQSGLQPGARIDGARPGHEPGIGESLPRSDRASNIGPGTTRGGVAPSLPQPAVGTGAEPEAYIRTALDALAAGKTGLAQEALEMAETQMLHRSVMPGQAISPADAPMVAAIRDARMALGGGNTAQALSILRGVPPN